VRLLSDSGDYNFIEFISNSKSGQFFFYSHDGQYMLKTQTKEENKFMIRILPHYYQYLTENPHSLLVRILGKCLFLRHFSCRPEQSTSNYAR
jgi:1-phosphatidylinositol-4-phosphate 5-kinase